MRWILIGTLLVLSMGEVFADARRGGKPASVSGTGEPVGVTMAGLPAKLPTAGKLPVTKTAIPPASSGVACLSCPAPDYPIEAAQRGTRGVVDLELTVSEDGRVEEVKVLAGPCDELKEASVKAAQGWTFTPAMRDGKPVREVVQVPVVFRLFQSYARLRQTSSNPSTSSPSKTR